MEIEAPPLPPQEPIHVEEVKEDVPATALPFTEGQSSEEEHFEFKMDMDEQRKEEADEKLVILALQGISMLKEHRPEEDTPRGGATNRKSRARNAKLSKHISL